MAGGMKRIFIAFLLYYATTMAMELDKDELLENRVPCLDKSLRYRKRPESLMKIRTQVAVLSINSISSAKMELSADVYLTHDWVDNRCWWRPLKGQGSVLTLYARPGEGSTWTHAGLNNLWQPDTQVLNAKSLSRPETVTHIRATGGEVTSRTRLSLTTSCPMDLKMYPMDRQMCQIIFQSSAHPNNELDYVWKDDTKLTFVQGLEAQDKMTPDFKLLGYKLERSYKIEESTGHNFTQLIVKLYLERPVGYFIWEVYMPASFIVFMSFTSFWLDRTATPARVSLGVTSTLTMTTLLSSSNNNLPPTAYPKSIGVFLAGCFLFTFLAMMEYAVASYLERRKTTRRLIKMSKSRQGSPNCIDPEKAPQTIRRQRKKSLAYIRDTLSYLKPAKVDFYSRFLFPMTFVTFLVIYSSYCLHNLEPLPDDMVILERSQEAMEGQ